MSRWSQWVREHIGSPRNEPAGPETPHGESVPASRAESADRTSLTARAQRLVEAAATRASESYSTVAQVHPALAAVNQDRWTLCATAAGACLGLQMMVRRTEILAWLEPLQDLVPAVLAAHHPEAPALYDQCRLQLARKWSTKSTFAGQNVILDAVGAWLLTRLFERPPTVYEQGVARMLGRTVDLPLEAWWD